MVRPNILFAVFFPLHILHISLRITNCKEKKGLWILGMAGRKRGEEKTSVLKKKKK
uniref:Uncharacterized protein n=1 Tax=Anguilla anguilla TaxID=7936 RepID=A0A0E9WZ17_ANGAN